MKRLQFFQTLGQSDLLSHIKADIDIVNLMLCKANNIGSYTHVMYHYSNFDADWDNACSWNRSLFLRMCNKIWRRRVYVKWYGPQLWNFVLLFLYLDLYPFLGIPVPICFVVKHVLLLCWFVRFCAGTIARGIQCEYNFSSAKSNVKQGNKICFALIMHLLSIQTTTSWKCWWITDLRHKLGNCFMT